MLVGESLRGQVADLVHPLLCQPVVELCLSIPAPLLAIGDLDRPHARAAYADRLPARVRDRRGKGDVTSVFARSIAQGLPVLRPFLMEGRLAAQGIIDPARLAPLLDPEAIIWRDLTGEIMRTVFIEAWARAWEARLVAAQGAGAEAVS
jgi:asparagine synthase (glutamine-hydrolysing)